jgi:hypothetical protein
MERCDAGLSFRIIRSRVHEYTNAPQALARLLRMCSERPRSRRASEQRDEIASFHC